jgi:peptide deformylase
MAILDILIWPDPKLAMIANPVEDFDAPLAQLADDLLETMYEADGVGLAATQVGVNKRIVVVDIYGAETDRPSGEEPMIIVNPEFLEKEGELTWEEGCLSVPGEVGDVTRAAKVRMRYFDLQGEEHLIEAEGLKAVALQHECDHLDGKVFVEYLSRMKRGVIKRKMLKLIAEREEEAA